MNEINKILDSVDDRLFIRLDDTPDELFYHMLRLVTHIDDGACGAPCRPLRNAPAGWRQNFRSDVELCIPTSLQISPREPSLDTG
jgi:hypothetical protein